MHDPIYDLTTIPEPDRIDVTNEGISAVIWATGFRFDYSWVKANAFDKFGYPKTDRGEASAPGLFFLGMNYLHTRKSGIVYGITGDANHVAARSVVILRRRLEAASRDLVHLELAARSPSKSGSAPADHPRSATRYRERLRTAMPGNPASVCQATPSTSATWGSRAACG